MQSVAHRDSVRLPPTAASSTLRREVVLVISTHGFLGPGRELRAACPNWNSLRVHPETKNHRRRGRWLHGTEEAGAGRGRQGLWGKLLGPELCQLSAHAPGFSPPDKPPQVSFVVPFHTRGSGKRPVGPESRLGRVRQDFGPHSLALESILLTGKGPRKSLRILEKVCPIVSLGPH